MLEGIEGATSVADRQITLDEAQDVPHRLITAMKCYAGNLIAFADPLQRHAEDGSTLDELVDALDFNQPWLVFVLEEDFRTTREIQGFAVKAWAPDRLDPSRPARKRGPLPRLIRGSFGDVALEARRLLASGIGSVTVASAHADRGKIVRAT